MYEKFRDYLYYLLPTPFKRLKKIKNQWYIFFKVIGDEYDKVQAELERALEETSVATCSVDAAILCTRSGNVSIYGGGR